MSVLQLLQAVSANQTGPTVSFIDGDISDDLSLDVFTAGTVSAFSIQLQGSIDGVDWVSIGSAVTTVGLTKPSTSTTPACTMFRANLASYSGTGTVSVNLGVVPLI
jgi:hypothetical protein